MQVLLLALGGDLAIGAVKAALGLYPEPLPGVGDVAEGHVGNDSCECQERLARIKPDDKQGPNHQLVSRAVHTNSGLDPLTFMGPLYISTDWGPDPYRL
ncbi:unnamed protein product [Caretta caretta]